MRKVNGDLLKRKIDKNATGSHGVYVARPWAVGVLIANEFIIQRKNATYGRRELKILGVDVNAETELIAIDVFYHSKLAAAIVF